MAPVPHQMIAEDSDSPHSKSRTPDPAQCPSETMALALTLLRDRRMTALRLPVQECRPDQWSALQFLPAAEFSHLAVLPRLPAEVPDAGFPDALPAIPADIRRLECRFPAPKSPDNRRTFRFGHGSAESHELDWAVPAPESPCRLPQLTVPFPGVARGAAWVLAVPWRWCMCWHRRFAQCRRKTP